MNVRTQSVASAVAAKPPFRAEHVGSLLRPAKLLRERTRFAKGQINAAELAAAEDAVSLIKTSKPRARSASAFCNATNRCRRCDLRRAWL